MAFQFKRISQLQFSWKPTRWCLRKVSGLDFILIKVLRLLTNTTVATFHQPPSPTTLSRVDGARSRSTACRRRQRSWPCALYPAWRVLSVRLMRLVVDFVHGPR